MGRLGTFPRSPLPSDRGANYPTDAYEAAAVLAAGVDWLTCTAKTPAAAELLHALGWGIVYRIAEEGNDLKPWLWKGYDGITAGSAAVGVRYDGAICRLSGGVAADYYSGPLRASENVSRIDLAVTVRLPSDANPAAEAYARPGPTAHKSAGRPVRKATHIQTWTEGETCYLGSRKSERLGRIYNKGLESHEEAYRDAWRWEVEYKGDAAANVAGALQEYGNPPETSLAYVWHQYDRWGIPPVWGLGCVVPSQAPVDRKSDDNRRLEWLATQVAPTIRGLLARGKGTEVLAALGLKGETSWQI